MNTFSNPMTAASAAGPANLGKLSKKGLKVSGKKVSKRSEKSKSDESHSVGFLHGDQDDDVHDDFDYNFADGISASLNAAVSGESMGNSIGNFDLDINAQTQQISLSQIPMLGNELLCAQPPMDSHPLHSLLI